MTAKVRDAQTGMAIVARGVVKHFGKHLILDDLSLQVRQGEIYRLIGANGAGKSTLLHLLLGLLSPNAGDVHVLGLLPAAARRQVGYLPASVRYHHHCSARAYLTTLGTLSDLHGRQLQERCHHALKQFGLQAAADRRIGDFSKGMLQCLGLAQMLLHEPELLLLDEPGSGGLNAGQFFVLGGAGILALTCYSTAIVTALSNRAQGYVVLTRSLGRSGYLAGTYGTALVLAAAAYVTLSVLVALVYATARLPFHLSATTWLLGTLPLFLNMAGVAAFVLLLSPLVPAAGLRLLLRPSIDGFALARTQAYDLSALPVLLGQVGLVAALLGAAFWSFLRRDIVFRS
ncbi:MAG: ATP-binding cassette domain-containing protein [Chloroflexi bacterium]|nr:ATP-binding cassette domain-containing protein [Chloroflexota bacterium]